MSEEIASYPFTEDGLEDARIPDEADKIDVNVDYHAEHQAEGEIVFIKEDESSE